MGMHEYLKSLSDLEMINRAPGYFKFEEHNVAAHSFKVTQAAQMLGDIEEHAGQEIDWRALYEKALNHDYTHFHQPVIRQSSSKSISISGLSSLIL